MNIDYKLDIAIFYYKILYTHNWYISGAVLRVYPDKLCTAACA